SPKARSHLVVACVALPFMLLAVCLRSACAYKVAVFISLATPFSRTRRPVPAWTGPAKLKATARLATIAAVRIVSYLMPYLTPIQFISTYVRVNAVRHQSRYQCQRARHNRSSELYAIASGYGQIYFQRPKIPCFQ